MKKLLPALALLVAPIVALPQAQLVINGTSPVTIVENGGTSATPIYIEIANPATDAITTIGNDGWIVSEAEFNMVKWDIGTSTGAYTVPFGYDASYALPLTATISSAGTGSGSILFSTYHTDPDNGDGTNPYNIAPNHVYPDIPPSDVTNMGAMYNPGNPSNSDNSYNVVDRFWVIDANKFAYTAKPTLSSINFSYISSGGTPSEVAAPNNFTETNLIAQRFNSTSGTWGDWLGAGPVTPGGNVGTADNTSAVTPANFFRSWTLSNSINPLPIQLSSFTAQCDNGAALIQWTSQTELNNAYYTVKKTQDNVHFETVDTVRAQGTGTSSFPENYSIIDNSPFAGQSYYFIYQTDIDGNTTACNIPYTVFNGCGTNAATTTITAYSTTTNIIININSIGADNYNISLVDMLGQVIYSGMHSVALGDNEIMLPDNVSPGVYILSVKNDKTNYAQKLVLGVR